VECIGKGKAYRPYEFGIKVSVATPLHRCSSKCINNCQDTEKTAEKEYLVIINGRARKICRAQLELLTRCGRGKILPLMVGGASHALRRLGVIEIIL